MLITVIIGYVLLCLIVALFSFKKRMGFLLAFAISLVLTPIAGIIAILKSDDFLQVTRYLTTYHCTRCNETFFEPHEICPNYQHLCLETHYLKEDHLTVA